MYDSEYFRKVIGNNYNPNDLYVSNTYNNNEGEKIYSVDAPITPNVDAQITSNEVSNTNNINIANKENNTNVISTNVGNVPVSSRVMSDNVGNVPVSNVIEPQEIYSENIPKRVYPKQIYNVSTPPITDNNKVKYPEIYNVLNPMVDTILREKQNIEYNDSTIDTMANEIYYAIEPENNQNQANTINNAVLVNAKPKNYLLHDLIKIMLIEKIEKA